MEFPAPLIHLGYKAFYGTNPEGITFHFGWTLEELKYNPIIIGHEQNLYFDPSLTLYVTPGNVSPEFKRETVPTRKLYPGNSKIHYFKRQHNMKYIGPETEKSPWGYHINQKGWNRSAHSQADNGFQWISGISVPGVVKIRSIHASVRKKMTKFAA